jgi:adenine-specific DNA-methyltransferase
MTVLAELKPECIARLSYHHHLSCTSKNLNIEYHEKSGILRVSKEADYKEGEVEITPKKDDGTDGRWRWGFDTAKQRVEDVYAKFMPNRQILGIFEKDYLDGRPPIKSTSAWTFKDVNSERGSEQFIDLGFGKEVFQRPKPIGTMKRVIEMGTEPHKKSIVLDFFAGSGTLAQAALQLNSSSKRNIHIILVQIPEPCGEQSEAFKAGFKTIAEISKERIRRAGRKILEGECHEDWNKDIGFRVLKVDSSNMTDVYYTPDAIDQKQIQRFTNNIKPDRTPEDLLFQVLLDWGVDLSLPIRKESIQGKTVFFVDENALVACFDTGVNEDLIKELAHFRSYDMPIRKIVFRDNGFVSDAVKINVEQIFKQMSPDTEVKAI